MAGRMDLAAVVVVVAGGGEGMDSAPRFPWANGGEGNHYRTRPRVEVAVAGVGDPVRSSFGGSARRRVYTRRNIPRQKEAM